MMKIILVFALFLLVILIESKSNLELKNNSNQGVYCYNW